MSNEEKLSTTLEGEIQESEAKPVEEAIVTSIAQEEAKTGQRVELTEEQALGLAAQQHTYGMKKFQEMTKDLSVRGLRRVIVALVQLPDLDGKMKSYLNGDDEKKAFAIGQMVLNAKFALFTGEVKVRRQKAMEEQRAKQALAEFNEHEKTNEPKATDVGALISEIKEEKENNNEQQ